MENMKLELNKTHCMDNREGMKLLPNNYIDLTITSPPYDDLRNYKGCEWNFEIFKEVAQELYRVTKDGGVVVWVVGDKTHKGSETGTSFRQALYFKEIGFNLWDTMIYQKIGGLKPNPKIPRFAPDFEYMFVLTKEVPKTFNEIRVPCANAGKTIGNTKKQRQLNGELKPIKLTNVEYKETKRKGNIWSYGVGNNKSTKDKIAFKHPAIFPEKLAEDHILSWSNEGDIVMDIFAGSGTVRKMCLLNNRNYIGFEIAKEYTDIEEERLSNYVG